MYSYIVELYCVCVYFYAYINVLRHYLCFSYLYRCLASREGLVLLGVRLLRCVCVCASVALVSAIQYSSWLSFVFFTAKRRQSL